MHSNADLEERLSASKKTNQDLEEQNGSVLGQLADVAEARNGAEKDLAELKGRFGLAQSQIKGLRASNDEFRKSLTRQDTSRQVKIEDGAEGNQNIEAGENGTGLTLMRSHSLGHSRDDAILQSPRPPRVASVPVRAEADAQKRSLPDDCDCWIVEEDRDPKRQKTGLSKPFLRILYDIS